MLSEVHALARNIPSGERSCTAGRLPRDSSAPLGMTTPVVMLAPLRFARNDNTPKASYRSENPLTGQSSSMPGPLPPSVHPNSRSNCWL